MTKSVVVEPTDDEKRPLEEADEILVWDPKAVEGLTEDERKWMLHSSSSEHIHLHWPCIEFMLLQRAG